MKNTCDNDKTAAVFGKTDAVNSQAATESVPQSCGYVDVTTLGVKNDGSADISEIVNAATEKSALYFPPGRYLVEKPLVIRHSIYGKGFSRSPDKASGDPELDDTRTWFISGLECEDGSQAIVSFGERRDINVEEINFMCRSAETAIRVQPGQAGNWVFIAKIGIYQLGGTGISIECFGSRPVFVQDICIWGSTRKYYEGSRGIMLRAWDCRLSNIEVMAAQIGLEVWAGYTYGENMHLWTGCMAKTGDKAAWWKGTRGLKFVGNAHLVGSNIYPDTSYYPFEFVGGKSVVDLRGIMYWDDRSEYGCEDRDGALIKCDDGADPCLKIDGGFWGVCGSDADPHWMKYLYQPKAEIRNVTVRSNMVVSGANLDTLCMNTELPYYSVDYAAGVWCKIAEVFTGAKSGSCEGTFTLDDGAAWALSFLKMPDKPAVMEAKPLNALCDGREIKTMPGNGTLKVFLRAGSPFCGRFVTTRMTTRFRPVDWGHLRTHDGAVRYREILDTWPELPKCVLSLDVGEGNPRNGEGDLVKLRDGRVLLVYTEYVGTSNDDNAHAHLVKRLSADGGETWTDPVEIFPRGGKMNDMSVSFLRMNDGRLGLFYLRKNSETDCRPVARYSTDEGETWSAPVETLPPEEDGYYVLNNARAARLKSGRIVLPLAHHSRNFEFGVGYGRLSCVYSDDDGKTWTKGAEHLPYDDEGKPVLVQEPGVVELNDGRLYLYARTDRGRQWQGYSSDGGVTFSDFGPSPIYGPLGPATIRRLPDGRLLLVWNDHEGHPEYTNLSFGWCRGVRAPVTVAFSSDEGQTWTDRITVEPEVETAFFCYFAVLVEKGYILLHYYNRPYLTSSCVTKVVMESGFSL